MSKILLTAFRAFGGEKINPSQQVLEALQSSPGIDTLILPVSYRRSFSEIQKQISQSSYEAILMLGQAGGRSRVGLERFSVNCRDSVMADCDEVIFSGQVIEPNGPAAYRNDLPLESWCQEAQKRKLPIEISNSAGTYVCNSLSYQVFHHYSSSGIHSLFVHLPYLPEQAQQKKDSAPSLELLPMKLAIEFCLDSINQV